MKNSLKALIFLPLVFLFCASCAEKPTYAREDSLLGIFQKEEITIAVTDSGLGGLAIMSKAALQMQETGIFKKVRFVFFNALFSSQGGYNSLKTAEEKVMIFNSALQSLKENYQPDLILVGCNTLSIPLDKTEFAQRTKIPLIGITDTGVKLIAQYLKAHPESKVILFATQTTVNESFYKDRLVSKGFLPERIVFQACPDLVDYIERGYESDETEMLIFAYVDEALKKAGNRGIPLLVSLNCTHYGFSLPLWEEAFTSLGIQPLAFLNPNSHMTDILFPEKYQNRFERTEITQDVVSMVEISQERIDSIGSCLDILSKQTVKALRDYDLQERLFVWKKYLKQAQDL